jgi:hypothetical protein
VRVEPDLACDVTARSPVDPDLQDLLLAAEVEVRRRRLDELEAAQLEVALPDVPDARVGARGGRRVPRRRGRGVGRVHVRRRVVEVDPPVRREVVVDRDALEPVLAVRVDVEVVDDRGRPAGRVDEPEVAAAGGLEDAAVGQDLEAHRLAEPARVRSEDLHLVVREHGRAAVARRDAGRPLDRAQEVGREGGLGVAPGRVAAGRVDGTAALEVPAPGDRVVEAHRAAGDRG